MDVRPKSAELYDHVSFNPQEEERRANAWPIPSQATMQERWAFRKSIREETLQHRRIHRHGGMGGTGWNIALVLRDRERRGASGVTFRRRRREEGCEKEVTIGQRENGVHFGSNGSREQPRQPPQPRRVSYPMTVQNEARTFAEYCSVIRYHSAFFSHLGGDDEPGEGGERPQSSKAVSTISIAFSPDSQTMASTHGDHTVKITCCSTGRLLQTLEGHPRTPWTVKYHPTNPSLVASGCLGHQVRVWSWPEKNCLKMIRLEYAIISLSFHPAADILAVASGTQLHFWGFRSSAALDEVEQRHMLRCVHFPPGGDTIIVGGVNPPPEENRRRARSGISGGGMSFYLHLWDFDVDAVFKQPEPPSALRRKSISNPRTIVPRALLYNDGGFDVSPDGKRLCACAEYWLPEGIENAMELLHREEQAESDEEDSESREREAEPEVGPSPTRTPTRITSGTTRGIPSPPRQRTPIRPLTSNKLIQSAATMDFAPRTPPNPNRPQFTLSPPSPPGRRFSGGFGQGRGSVGTNGIQPFPNPQNQNNNNQTPAIPPPPPPPGMVNRPPHPLSIVSGSTNYSEVSQQKGRYVPHVVTISLDTAPIPAAEGLNHSRARLASVARGYRPRLGQLLEACPLDGAKASAVTCVKFSPSTDFCLIGYGVREPVVEGGGQYHPVTALYRVKGGMTQVSTMLSGDDDVNIARFHPDSGYGFVYGTKQGRVRVLSPRPWNYYTR